MHVQTSSGERNQQNSDLKVSLCLENKAILSQLAITKFSPSSPIS